MLLRRWWPTLGALVILAAIGGPLIGAAVRHAGHFAYTLDDAYIELAIAKNLVAHQVWGVTEYEFSSAASSILWPLLMAAVFLLTGPHEVAGLALTLLGGVVTIVVSGGVLGRCGVWGWRQFAALVAIVVLAPIIPVAMTGLEHTAHGAATVGLAYLGAVVLAERKGGRRGLRLGIQVCAMSALTVLLRYEGLFLTAGIVGVLLLQRRTGLAAALVASAWAPVVVYGIVSTGHDAMWLPNPVAIKGSVGSLHSLSDTVHDFLGKWLDAGQVKKASHLILLGVLAGALYLRRWRAEWERPTVAGFMALTFVPAVALHLLLGGLGYFFRYELYLVVLGIVVAAANLAGGRPAPGTRHLAEGARPAYGPWWRLAVPALVLLTCVPLVVRGAAAHRRVPDAARDIFNLDHQLARFVGTYYDRDCVVLNDIGVVSFRTNARLLDIWGLANSDTARLYLRGQLDSGTVGRLAAERSARIAAVYDHLLRGGPPPGWRKVAVWNVHNRALAMHPLNFYATSESEAAPLREHMREFARTMNADVDVVEEPAGER